MTRLPRPVKPPTPPRQSPQVSFGQRPQLVGSFTIGNSDTSEADRRVGQGIKQTGWSGFVAGVVQQAIDDGFKRFSLHNPFGTLAGQQMLASQYLHAKAANLPWLTDGFVEAWQPITKRFEVIAYQGSIKEDPSFKQEWEAGLVPFAGYVKSCYQPVIDAGMSVAFDAHIDLPIGNHAIAAARFVGQDTKRPCYFEPGPAAGDYHWFKAGCNVWIANDNSSIVQNWREPWQLDPLPSTTETILQLSMAPADIIRGEKYNAPKEYVELWEGCEWENYPQWIGRFVRYHIDKGRSVAVNPRDFARFGLKVKDVVGVTP